jgi:hypothetical protein
MDQIYMAWFATKPILMRCYKNKIEKKNTQNIYLCYEDEKQNISDDLLEIAGRGKAECSNEPEILFSSMYHRLFFSRLQKNTRKNFHSVVKVTFDP